MSSSASKTSSSSGGSSSFSAIARLLWRAGWLLIGLAVVVIVFALLPTKPFDPSWQMGLVSALLGNGMILLTGSLFICLSTILDSDLLSAFRLVIGLRTVAAWFCIALFLLIPLQINAASTLINRRFIDGKAELRDFRRTIERIGSSKTEKELRQVLGSLPSPPPLPASFDAPFPVIQQRLLDNLNRRLNTAETSLNAVRSNASQASISECLRNGLSLALLGTAFGAVAVSDPRQRTVVSSLLRLSQSLRRKKLKLQGKKDLSKVISPGWVDSESTRN